jgi:hypothetical protein
VVGERAHDYIRLGIGGLLGHDGDLDALCRSAVELIRTSGITLLKPTAVTPPGSPTSAARA